MMSNVSCLSVRQVVELGGVDELQGEVGNGVANLPFSEAQRRLF